MTKQAKNPPTKYRKWREQYGSVAIVTGASSGIGRDMAIELAQRGLNLVLVARREVQLAELAQDLDERFGVSATVLSLDLSQDGASERLFEATRDMDVGLLVACAGFGTSGAFLRSEIDAERSMLTVNCQALYEQTLMFAQRFAERGRGGIILMSSIVAWQGVPHAAHYAATKAYVQSLVEGIYGELKAKGVDVLASAPGPVQSGFGERAGMTMEGAASPRKIAKGTIQALGKKRTVQPHFMGWFLSTSLAFLPRVMRVRIMAQVMAGFTKEQA